MREFSFNMFKRNPIILIIENKRSNIVGQLVDFFNASHKDKIVFTNNETVHYYKAYKYGYVYNHYDNNKITKLLNMQKLATKVFDEEMHRCPNGLIVIDNIIPDQANFTALLKECRSHHITVIFRLHVDKAINLLPRFRIYFNHIFICPTATLCYRKKCIRIYETFGANFPTLKNFKRKAKELESLGKYVVIVHTRDQTQIYTYAFDLDNTNNYDDEILTVII